MRNETFPTRFILAMGVLANNRFIVIVSGKNEHAKSSLIPADFRQIEGAALFNQSYDTLTNHSCTLDDGVLLEDVFPDLVSKYDPNEPLGMLCTSAVECFIITKIEDKVWAYDLMEPSKSPCAFEENLDRADHQLFTSDQPNVYYTYDPFAHLTEQPYNGSFAQTIIQNEGENLCATVKKQNTDHRFFCKHGRNNRMVFKKDNCSSPSHEDTQSLDTSGFVFENTIYFVNTYNSHYGVSKSCFNNSYDNPCHPTFYGQDFWSARVKPVTTTTVTTTVRTTTTTGQSTTSTLRPSTSSENHSTSSGMPSTSEMATSPPVNMTIESITSGNISSTTSSIPLLFIILGAVLFGVVFLIVLCIIAFCCYDSKKNDKEKETEKKTKKTSTEAVTKHSKQKLEKVEKESASMVSALRKESTKDSQVASKIMFKGDKGAQSAEGKFDSKAAGGYSSKLKATTSKELFKRKESKGKFTRMNIETSMISNDDFTMEKPSTARFQKNFK